MKIAYKTICLGLIALVGIVGSITAADQIAPNPFLEKLISTPAGELPEAAASLVSKSDTTKRQQVTVDVVKAAIGLNPAAATLIVGAIAQSCPDMAGIAAATAVLLVPDQLQSIAHAAAAAAPKQAGQIVEALCKVMPKSYKKIALAVAEASPAYGREILQGLASGIPALKSSVNKVLAGANGNISLSSTIDQVIPDGKSDLADIASDGTITRLAITPVVQPPYVPPSGTPQNIDPGSGGEVPGGGRGYAAP